MYIPSTFTVITDMFLEFANLCSIICTVRDFGLNNTRSSLFYHKQKILQGLIKF